MKYYLIAGEASGDLHTGGLMQELKKIDPDAEFRFFGGEKMQEAGGEMVRHYRELAYMGFIPVLLHAHTILKNMRHCKEDIIQYKPDVLILTDYPGFNLNIAKHIHRHTDIPIHYYISPKLWAWKEYRIKNIKRDVDYLYSILPFEKDFFEGKYGYHIDYVGNPTATEINDFIASYHSTQEDEYWQDSKPIIAILAGSRRQEIKDNLCQMLKAAEAFPQYRFIIAGAPSIEDDFYQQQLQKSKRRGCTIKVDIVYGKTLELLAHSEAALVTSGTATLETALMGVPQVVCYYTPIGKIISLLRKIILKVRYISLVNLIMDSELVTELVASTMKVENIRHELSRILTRQPHRQEMLDGYRKMKERLGSGNAPRNAATLIFERLKTHSSTHRK
ncbi:MAG: lipid-A-disaccharide synthase [Prevotella sp.]|nr:lipid-A-disaccharide synthase [Candidatus Equicola faecalis]